MIFLLFLAGLVFADDSPPKQEPLSAYTQKIDGIESNLSSLTSGRGIFTSTPTFRGGVCFADNTCQHTAAGTLSGSNSFSGQNLFIAGSTVNISGYNNLEIMISSGDFSLVTAATIPVVSAYYGTTSSGTYHLEIETMFAGTATIPYFMVGGDNGTNYAYALNRTDASSGGNTANAATGQRHIKLTGSAETISNTFGKFDVYFNGAYSIKNVIFNISGVYGNNGFTSMKGGGTYTASQAVSSLTFTTNATNDISGHWALFERQHWQP